MSVDGSLLNANFIASRALTNYARKCSHTGSVGSTLVLEATLGVLGVR